MTLLILDIQYLFIVLPAFLNYHVSVHLYCMLSGPSEEYRAPNGIQLSNRGTPGRYVHPVITFIILLAVEGRLETQVLIVTTLRDQDHAIKSFILMEALNLTIKPAPVFLI